MPGAQQSPQQDGHAGYDWPGHPEADYEDGRDTDWYPPQHPGAAGPAGRMDYPPGAAREGGRPTDGPGVGGPGVDGGRSPTDGLGPDGHAPADHTADRDHDDALAAALGPRRRGKKPLVITLVLLLLLGLGGGALAVPDVANRLALPWAPNAPQQPPPEPLAVQRSLIGPEQATSAPTPNGVSAALERAASNPALGTLSGSVVDPVSGDVLWERNAAKPLPPASTTKLLTAAAALLSIDHTATLSTKVVKGTEPGSVVLVAGGDPTLSSVGKGEDSFYTDAARLNELVKQVRKSAGDVSTVYLDTSAYQGGSRAPGWEPGDAPSTYAAPVEPAMLDGGRTDPSYDESMRTGDPAGALAKEFADRLGARVAGSASGSGAAVLGEVHSAPLPTLVDDLLTVSDNVLAEAVARQVALAVGKPPSFQGGAAATKQVLRKAGFDVSGVTLADGSGLSADNAIPAKLLSDILATAAGDTTDPTSAKLRPLLTGLPVAGGTGTLDDRYLAGGNARGKGWIRAKTGTLSGVNTLAGVVLTKNGRLLVFALMSSGTSSGSARPALDAVAATLRGCGCR